jgi:hypothetical protein
MPKRIPVQAVMVFRNGKLVRPEMGVPVEFSAEEIADVTAMNQGALRKIVDESELISSEESKVQGTLSVESTPEKTAKSEKADKGGAKSKANGSDL